jgi:hypothetical protein
MTAIFWEKYQSTAKTGAKVRKNVYSTKRMCEFIVLGG